MTRPNLVRRAFAAGFAATVVVSLAFMSVTDGTQLWIVATAVFASGFALGTWNVPNNSSILGSVPTSRLGVTGAFTNLARTLGSVVGQAITTAVVVGVMASQGLDVPLDEIADTPGAVAAFTDGWRAGFAIAGGLCMIAAVLANRGGAVTVPPLFLPSSGGEESSPCRLGE